MTKKDYVAIALILRETRGRRQITVKVADYCQKDNPCTFDRDRFLIAARVKRKS
jgi:hypothetical protein